MTTSISIPVEVRNPGAYLAACGVVEIIGAFDMASTSRWERRSVPLRGANLAASACIVQTSIPEREVTAALLKALSNRDPWKAFTLDGRRLPLDQVTKDEPLSAVGMAVRLLERQELFAIDHWYHRTGRADDPKLKERLKDGKSIWKFWGGRMSVQKTLLGEGKKPGLITALSSNNGAVTSIDDLLTLEHETGSSLNLDAGARRGALDRGIAANEAKRATGDAAAARPAVEILGAIGLSAFFAPRRLGGRSGTGIHATAGFDGQHFRYCTWALDVSLPIARIIARGVKLPGVEVLEGFAARRVSAGGKNYRFEYARGSGTAISAAPEPEEDDDAEADANAD